MLLVVVIIVGHLLKSLGLPSALILKHMYRFGLSYRTLTL